MQFENFSLIEKQLVEILKHPIIQTIYEYIIGLYFQAKATSSKKPNTHLSCFQDYVKTIQSMPSTLIIEETEKIKNKSNFNKIDLEVLLDAIIKTKIFILSKYNTNKFELLNYKIDLTTFIHKCYIESGKYAHNESYLIYQEGIPALEISKNINKFKKLIDLAIDHSINFMIPLNLILPNYISSIKNLNPRNISFLDDTSDKHNDTNSIEVGKEIAQNFMTKNLDNKYNSVVQKDYSDLNNNIIPQKQASVSKKINSPEKNNLIKNDIIKNEEIKIGGKPKSNEKNSLTVISRKESIKHSTKHSTPIVETSNKNRTTTSVESGQNEEDSVDDSEYPESSMASDRDVITRRLEFNNRKKRTSDYKTPLEQFG